MNPDREDGGAVVLAGGDPAVRGEIESRAAARGVAIDAVDSLDDAAIQRATCVILADPAGPPSFQAFDVLAAGRILLLPRSSGSFGLEDGLDHLEFADADEAITLVESYRRAPEAFARVSVWARVKARALRS
jgi:hypothetical protein